MSSPAAFPCVIGATGGSGTRAFAAIARTAGLYTGSELNDSEDARPFARFSDRWINAYLLSRGGSRQDEIASTMRRDLRFVLDVHLNGCPPGSRWGWKEPRCIYYLPLLAQELPSLRFLHVVRDGRDMAFSENQNQRRKHADAALGPDPSEPEPEPVRSIRLWAWINGTAADFGERELGDRYLRLRFEDLCERPAETVERLLRFFELEGDAEELAALVSPPTGIGRHREQAPELIDQLERAAGAELARFGYVGSGASATPPDDLSARIASFPRWHYRFDLRGHVTPVPDERANRHEQRRRYLFGALLQATGGSLEGKRVLDLACNAGFWSLAAVEAGAEEVVGIEGRQMHVDQARLVFEANDVPAERYEFVKGDILELDLETWGRFDVVLCLGVLYHVDEPVRLFRRMAAVNDDLLLVDTGLSALPGAAFQLGHDSVDDPRDALERELVLLPTRGAVLELAAANGYRTVVLPPRFSDDAGAEEYEAGTRRGLLCAKRTSLDGLEAEG